jgi:Tol biopolymer transport system component
MRLTDHPQRRRMPCRSDRGRTTLGRWACHLLLLGTITVITSCSADVGAEEDAEREVIVFQRGGSELHATDPDGRNRRVLQLGESGSGNLSLSADATKFAYVGGAGGDYSLYVVDLAGLKRRRLAVDVHGYFDWSPEGHELVLVQSGADDRPWLWIVDGDGRHRTRLAAGTHPLWAPDGRILFNRDGYHFPADSVGQYAIRPDRSEEQRLIRGDEVRGAVAVSKDGSRLAFIGYGGVFVANGDGSDRRQITSEAKAGDLEWSPNGDSLAFFDGDSLVIVDRDGKNPRRLGRVSWPNDGSGARFAWSSDQQWIAIEGLSAGARTDIFVVDVRTGAQHRITDAAGSGAGSRDSFTSPDWIPASRVQGWMRRDVTTMTGPRGVLCSSEIAGQWVATLSNGKAALAPQGVSPGEYLLTLSDGYFRLEPNLEGASGNEQSLECRDGQQLVISMGYGGAPGYECEDAIGTYTWRRARNEVRFVEASDADCPLRAFVLTQLRWRPRR